MEREGLLTAKRLGTEPLNGDGTIICVLLGPLRGCSLAVEAAELERKEEPINYHL